MHLIVYLDIWRASECNICKGKSMILQPWSSFRVPHLCETYLSVSERPGAIPNSSFPLNSIPNPSPYPANVTSEISLYLYFSQGPLPPLKLWVSYLDSYINFLSCKLQVASSCLFSVCPLILFLYPPATVIFLKTKSDHIILCHYLLEIIPWFSVVLSKKAKKFSARLCGGSRGSAWCYPAAVFPLLSRLQLN